MKLERERVRYAKTRDANAHRKAACVDCGAPCFIMRCNVCARLAKNARSRAWRISHKDSRPAPVVSVPAYLALDMSIADPIRRTIDLIYRKAVASGSPEAQQIAALNPWVV